VGYRESPVQQVSFSKAAILGGPKNLYRHLAGWPVIDQIDEKELLDVLESGNWCRLGVKTALRFEEEYQKLLGSKYALPYQVEPVLSIQCSAHLKSVPVMRSLFHPYTFIAT